MDASLAAFDCVASGDGESVLRHDTTVDCAQIMAGMWATLQVHSQRYEQALKGDFLLATELADYLVQKNVAFRDAHHVVGRIVAHCEAQGCNFSALTAADLQGFHQARTYALLMSRTRHHGAYMGS